MCSGDICASRWKDFSLSTLIRHDVVCSDNLEADRNQTRGRLLKLFKVVY